MERSKEREIAFDQALNDYRDRCLVIYSAAATSSADRKLRYLDARRQAKDRIYRAMRKVRKAVTP